MTTFHENARAKLNLSLEVLGRRGDGFHEIRSLVTFATVGDVVSFEPAEALALSVDGPFARYLSGDNLVLQAAHGLRAAFPSVALGRFHLEKNLPVASGIGGGSADAAAALRLISAANGGTPTHEELLVIAASLGSDVPVCVDSRSTLMTGRGEVLRAVRGFPSCGVVLANPGVPLSAAEVYSALNAKPLAASVAEMDAPDFATGFDALLDYLKTRPNDLQSPATQLAPVIGDVLPALEALPGARLARMSGSGATCFALFAAHAEAEAAKRLIAEAHPDWWIAAGGLA